MKKQSIMRALKRKAMREGGVTFTQRALEAARLKMPIRGVKYSVENKVVKAERA